MGSVLGAGVFHESELCEVEYVDVKIPAKEKNDKIRSFVGETSNCLAVFSARPGVSLDTFIQWHCIRFLLPP